MKKMTIGAFILGPSMGGGTELAKLLANHPEIALHPKGSAHYFDLRMGNSIPADAASPRKPIRTLSYLKSFKAPADKFRIDATDGYFYWPWCPAAMNKAFPEAKYIVVLREPIARTFHHIDVNRQEAPRHFTHEYLEPEQAFRKELVFRESAPYPYHERMCYQHQNKYITMLERLMLEVPANQILFLDWGVVRKRPRVAVNRVFNFLGLEPTSRLPKIDRDPLFWNKDLAESVPVKIRAEVWRSAAPHFKDIMRLTGLDTYPWLRV